MSYMIVGMIFVTGLAIGRILGLMQMVKREKILAGIIIGLVLQVEQMEQEKTDEQKART